MLKPSRREKKKKKNTVNLRKASRNAFEILHKAD